mgnify:CR=1 FL=1
MGLFEGFWGLILVLVAVLDGWLFRGSNRSGWLLVLLTGVEAAVATLLVPPIVWQRVGFTWVVLWLMSAMSAAWFRKRSDGAGH